MEKKIIEFARRCMMDLLSNDDPNDPDRYKAIDALSLIKINKILNKFETEPLSTEPMTRSQEPEKEEMDKCVNCGKETKYPKQMHIAFRFNYIEGAGQLCDDCADKIYKPHRG